MLLGGEALAVRGAERGSFQKRAHAVDPIAGHAPRLDRPRSGTTCLLGVGGEHTRSYLTGLGAAVVA
jgi:hypothetical protein